MPTPTAAATSVDFDFDIDGPFSIFHLMGRLASPFDLAHRRHYLAVIAVDLLEDAPNVIRRRFADVEPDKASPLHRAVAFAQYNNGILDELLNPAGGMLALRDAPSIGEWRRISERFQRSPVIGAARLLLFVAQMKQQHPQTIASTKRAIEVLRSWTRSTGLDAPAEREWPYMWARHGDVAPLYASAIASMDIAKIDLIPRAVEATGGARACLARALWLQNFALSHVSRGASGPLLTRRDVLKFPEGLKPLEVEFDPMSPSLLAAAMGYKAPQPAQ